MNISLIIVNYNAKKSLQNCLNSLRPYWSYLKEVIVIDNHSSDDSATMIKNNFSEIKLLINNKNFGFGAANNQGAKIAQGETLFFLNPDTLIQEDIFNPVVKVFLEDKKLGVVAPQLVLPDGRPQPWASGKDWLSGAALFVRKKVFERLGGFDENFFMYFEDRDFCRRAKKIGYGMKILSEIKVIHFGGQSLPDNKTRKRLYYQAQSYYWQKHYGWFISLFLGLVRWLYLIFGDLIFGDLVSKF
ncbi:MAG: glycosyltransferase family 2 protein [Patescibacteria group bacterium]|nr:glycosyltransferase family 2 protein [Patescibacteria group bacterium]